MNDINLLIDELAIILVRQSECWKFANDYDAWNEKPVKILYDSLTSKVDEVKDEIVKNDSQFNVNAFSWKDARERVKTHNLSVPVLTLDLVDLNMDDQRVDDILECAAEMLIKTGLSIEECIVRLTHIMKSRNNS